MREILFKAKRKDNGKWVEGYLVYRAKSVSVKSICEPSAFICGQKLIYERHIPKSLENYEYEVEPETICQCTNKPDKNGKQIFENDFVRFTPRLHKELVWQGKVVREGCQYVICEFYNGEYDSTSLVPLSKIPSSHIEIIENIYDKDGGYEI